MWPYYVLILIPQFLGFNIKVKLKTRNGIIEEEKPIRLTYFFFFFILFLLLALRDSRCGADTRVYEYYFNYAANTSFRELFISSQTLGVNNVEIGYLLLNKIVAIISGNNYQVFLAVTAFVSIFPVYLFYKRENLYSRAALLMFLYLVPFSTLFSMIRQVIAMSLVPLAFKLVREKKLLKFVVLILFASSFHVSALIILLLYPVYWAKYEKKTLHILLPVFGVTLAFNKQLFGILNNFFISRLFDRYSETTSTGAFGMLLLFLVLTIYVFIIPDEKELNQDEKGLRNVLVLVTLLQCFAPIHTIAMRMTNFFQYFIPIAVLQTSHKARSEYKQISYLFVVGLSLFCLFMFIYKAYTGDDILNIFPYVAFWESNT